MAHYFRAVLVVGAAVLCAPLVAAQDGLALMQVEHGARVAGMGTAQAAVAGGPDAVLYNPALAGRSAHEFEGSFGYTSYWENVTFNSGYMTWRVAPRWRIHGGIRYAEIGDLELRTIPSLDPDGLFEAYDVSFKGGATYHLTDNIAVGAAVGWFIEKIEAWRGSAFNVDLGVQAELTPQLQAGAAVTNLGSEFKLEKAGARGSTDISLPTTYRAGLAYRYDRFLGAVDVVNVDDETHVHLGAEAALHEMFVARAGYMLNYDSKGFTAGASFFYRNFGVDYAFVPYQNDLGTSHMFNLTFSL